MARRTGWMGLAALALLGGCAEAPRPRDVGAIQARPAAERVGVVECSTTYVVIATVSRCGSGGFKLGVAGE